MKILYSGCFCDEDIFNNLLKEQIAPPSYAQQKLERMLLEGLSSQESVNIEGITMIPSRCFPGNKRIFWRTKIFKKNNIYIKQLGMINILIIKQVCIALKVLVYSFIWMCRNFGNKNKAVLSYSINPPITFGLLFTAKLLGCKCIAVITELPQYRVYLNQNTLIRRILLNIFTKTMILFQNWFDGYIVLTEDMNKVINKKGKPYVVIEGMIDDTCESLYDLGTYTKTTEKKVIMYAGSLHKRYGIQYLIEAFRRLEEDNLELWVFGKGDYEKELESIIENDPRIIYFGIVQNKEILLRERTATLLVNPRPTSDIYTHYSFPSKILEYMCSGTPVLTTRLAGIPKEYNDYLLWIEKEDVEGIKEAIRKALNSEDLFEIGIKARDFVIRKKNNILQTSYIIKLLKEVINEKEQNKSFL